MKEIRSKYQKKILEEVEYTLDEVTCHDCKQTFMMDFGKCQYTMYPDQARSAAVYYCPYCGKHQALTI